MGFILRSGVKRKDEMPRFLPTFIYTTFCMGIAGFVLIMTMVIGAARAADSTDIDYCIVMGARVYANGISRTLMYRLEKAYEVYTEDPDTVFVLAGGQDTGDAIPEAFAMYNYLSMKNMPSNVLLMEPKSTSTFGIIRNASAAIRADSDNRKIPKGPGDYVWAPDYEPKVGIITSDYHMFRSLILAGQNGLKDPVAIPARSDDVLFVHNCVRESASILKDFFMGNVIIDEQHMPEVPFSREKRN